MTTNPPAPESIPESAAFPKKRGRGRPKGSLNRPKPPQVPIEATFPIPELYAAALERAKHSDRVRRVGDKQDFSQSPDFMLDRDMAIYCEWIKGKSQYTLAREQGLTQGRVSQICDEVAKRLVPIYADHIEQIRQEHYQRLDYLYEESAAAWERSKLPTACTTESAGAKGATTSTTITQQIGNATFLAECRAILKDQRLIYNVDAPKKGPEGEIDDGSEEPRVAGKPIEEARQEWLKYHESRLFPSSN